MKCFLRSLKLFSFIIVLISLSSCGKKNTKNKAPQDQALETTAAGKLDDKDLNKPDKANPANGGEIKIAPNSTYTNTSAELESLNDDIWCLGDKGPREPLSIKGGIVDGTSLKKVKFYDNEHKKNLSGKHEMNFFDVAIDGNINKGTLGVEIKLGKETLGMFRNYRDDSEKKNCVKPMVETYTVKDRGTLCSENPRLDITTIYHAGVVMKLYVLSEPTTHKIISLRYVEKEQDYSLDHNAFAAKNLVDGKVRYDLCVRDFSEK